MYYDLTDKELADAASIRLTEYERYRAIASAAGKKAYELGLAEAESRVKAREYKANFLWPPAEGSVEQAGYEFANGTVEEYCKLWWDILLARVVKQREQEIVEWLEQSKTLPFHWQAATELKLWLRKE